MQDLRLIWGFCSLCWDHIRFCFAFAIVTFSFLETSLILCFIVYPGLTMPQDPTAQKVLLLRPSWLAAMARYAFVTRKGLDLVTDAAMSCNCSGVPGSVLVEYRF